MHFALADSQCYFSYQGEGTEAELMRILAILGASLCIAACTATGPATYGAADAKGFGYEETRIENDRYRITYRGSGGMPPEQVEDYALLRAAELALANDFDWFRVTARDLAGEERGGVSVGAGFGTGSYGRRSSVGVGVGGDLGRIGAQAFYTARLEVLFGEGDKPEDGDVYDAASIANSIIPSGE